MEEQTNSNPSASFNNEEHLLKAKIAGGAGWFFWIAGLSLFNSLVVMFHGSFTFVVGLFTTRFIDYMLNAFHYPVFKGIAIAINLVIIAIYAGIGVGAKKSLVWVFITGLVLYVIDTVLLVFIALRANAMGDEMFSGIFHLLALVSIWGGLQASMKLKKMQSSIAYMVASESK